MLKTCHVSKPLLQQLNPSSHSCFYCKGRSDRGRCPNRWCTSTTPTTFTTSTIMTSLSHSTTTSTTTLSQLWVKVKTTLTRMPNPTTIITLNLCRLRSISQSPSTTFLWTILPNMSTTTCPTRLSLLLTNK
jgi:hypothetical protein